MLASRPSLHIDMIADPICPWCYIGFRSLDWALMALSFEVSPQVQYRPYRLDPETPKGGRDRAATLASKFPDTEARQRMDEALRQAMNDVGVSFDPETPKLIPDTTDAHRLLRWAHDENLQHDVLAGLFEAYWQHGEDLSRREVLVQVAEAAGMNTDNLADRLATAEDVSAVRDEAAELRGGGVDSVPTFIVNEQTGFAGALPKAQMLDALRQLAQETSAMDEEDED
ncbi:DsbA family oxidoreductase [Parvularcula sp. LCG005]|uniref:DsbA family oxidoreductase n=1 Tax=Parvularcula sp. LCG005 TaxID=3078805 RepID=UPI002942813D|nr:DsbA family oxidoreductase [Parvularcula sp. LCG005]WOI52641.1 DsbA family oxidoreductase [Parvularcula sp. LCG005]